MSHYLFQQLKFVRKATIDYGRSVSEERWTVIPPGLNNHIMWNLGHIYMITEKFAFQLTGEKTNVPDNFLQLFDSGTSPKDWSVENPAKGEVITLLNEQSIKIESLLLERIEEPIKEIYSTSTGLQISNVVECLSFCLYHEGMHFGVIKGINQLLQN